MNKEDKEYKAAVYYLRNHVIVMRCDYDGDLASIDINVREGNYKPGLPPTVEEMQEIVFKSFPHIARKHKIDSVLNE